MLQDLSDEADAINRSDILFCWKSGLLCSTFRHLQDSKSSVEYQDIEAILNERQAIHDIMQRLDRLGVDDMTRVERIEALLQDKLNPQRWMWSIFP